MLACRNASSRVFSLSTGSEALAANEVRATLPDVLRESRLHHSVYMICGAHDAFTERLYRGSGGSLADSICCVWNLSCLCLGLVMQGHSLVLCSMPQASAGHNKTQTHRRTCMAAQILCSSGGSRVAEENLAAVHSALMDMLSRGGAFAGLSYACACRPGACVQGI